MFSFALRITAGTHKAINASRHDVGIIIQGRPNIQENIRRNVESTKRVNYLSTNPSLTSTTVYNNNNIKEYKRVEYTRSRLSSHTLRIETGKWSRTPREDCVLVLRLKTENHVFLHCEHTQEFRNKYNVTDSDLDTLFHLDGNMITNFIYEVMKNMKY